MLYDGCGDLDRTVKYPKEITENVLVGIGKFVFPVDFIILDMPEDIKVPLILGRPFLSTARAKSDVFKKKITLRAGEERTILKSVKPASSLIKRVYMLSLSERIELDLEARLMGETLVLNRSLDLLNGDYIELNDLNKPLEHRGDQGDDLMPTIEEGEVIKEFRTRDDELDTGIDDYHSTLRNVPIFVGTFYVVTDFAVLEDMNAYRNEVMGDVIVGEPFLKEIGIKARRFDGMITNLPNGAITSENSLWVKVVNGEDGKIGKKVQPRHPSTWLNNINEIESLKLHVPRLYAPESMKNIEIASKLSHGGHEFSFRRNPRGGVKHAQFERLKEMVEGVTLSNSNDRWSWSLVGSDDFSVSSVRKLIDNAILSKGISKTRWIKEAYDCCGTENDALVQTVIIATHGVITFFVFTFLIVY
uniref:Reverse transcriptase domain-containing protein n=1 Tax=Tanacetum cinerariifolium TaxID=118510 RepID=A0A699HC71_TANCI|nr:hypothetical protein [Tanacetum cinerariifolium]